METVQVMLPVLVMLAIGFIFRKTGFVGASGMEGIRKYIITIALPVTIFHAMGIADINKNTGIIVIIMLAVLALAMLSGFLTRGLIPEPYKNYLPFLVTVFEGGMFAYPLYQNLCGEDKFVNIVIVDIAGCIFGFGLFYGLLALVDQNTKFSLKLLGITAIKSPTFIAVVLGLLLNLTGLMEKLIESGVGNTYVALKNMIVAPLSTMILIYVGYMLKIDKKLFAVCIRSIAIRVITMTILCVIVLNILKTTVEDKYMYAAFLVYFIGTPTFSLPSFVKNKDAAEYFAMTTSMYVAITIVGYAVIASTMRIN